MMSTAKLQVKIGGMGCSFCAATIEKGLGRIEGVAGVHVSLAHEEALVTYDPKRVKSVTLTGTLQSLGYTVRDPDKIRTFEEEEAELRRERDRLIIAGAAAWVAFMAMFLMWSGRPHPWTLWILTILAFLMVFGLGLNFLKMAWASARRRILNQHVLMEVAAFGGLLGGAIGLVHPLFPSPDFFGVAVFVTAYHLLGNYASLLVRTRSSQAVKKLLSLQPPTARVVRDGSEVDLPIEEVRRGDRVRIRPGEQIPVDGVVEEGISAVDESLVTGESIPREKLPGQEVIGGSVNHSGTLLVRVSKVGEESFLRQVARHIQEARALKPGILLLLDRILVYFVPGVLAVGAAAFFFWTLGGWILFGLPDWDRAGFAALAVLVMGYPCALGMATPLAMIRGGGEAARQGILMRSAASFQAFKDVWVVVLDKTGTITHGKPQVVEVLPLNEWKSDELLALAASAEQVSEHPLGRAVVGRAKSGGLALDRVEDFEAVAGKGIRAVVGGRPVLVGTLRFLAELGVTTDALSEPAAEREARGGTVITVAVDDRAAGLMVLADAVKEDAAEAVAGLRRAGMEPVMITGDNERTARAVAGQVGIREVLAQVLPQEKAERVRAFQREEKRVAMVGDGINDAPALMQADVGLAMASGTDIAMESADIVLVGERLTAVVDAYHIARRSYRKTVQNLAIAFSFNGVGVPLAATGLVAPAWAMAAMAASVTAVMLNSFGGRLVPRHGKPPAAVRRVTLRVPSIHCQGCVTKIQETLGRLPAVVAVEGDPQTKQVVVTMRNGQAQWTAIEEALTRLGHVIGGD
ncbi:MAG: heavy metal translocating P-type ATPase [Candidatus Tectomicrobia bacterium]|uniref:Heavy metal translocating P-type ATPase n=1 Tax=Tectimicrobiota bacterium TaxID=2528274 RepID=A0A932M033_UNCTE|nr:heavy metal translocating P-type ATPase [Candidatus Tectomicrobia bacterium]